MKMRTTTGRALLVMALAASALQAQHRSGAVVVGLSVGATYGLGYSYEYRDPFYTFMGTLRVTDGLTARGAPVFSLSAGYFVSSRLEIFCGSFYLKSGHRPGRVFIAIPSNYSGNVDTGYDRQGRRLQKIDVLFGARYHFASLSRIKPYAGIGLSYSIASLQFLSDALFSYSSDELMITRVDLETVRLHALGGFAAGGAELALRRRLTIFAEVLYEFSGRTIVDPFSRSIDSPENVRINLGGFIASGGLRFHF